MEIATALNKAHQMQRKADALLKQKKYDECIECHKQASDLLADALNLSENAYSLESLRLQRVYHQKQIEKILVKKSHKKLHHNRETMIDSENELEATIYRTIDVHDSLIDYLGRRGGSDNDIVRTGINESKENQDKETCNQIVGNKHPKDDSVVIEELKELSGQLRESVQCLLLQLDDRNKEIESLKANIKELENDKQKDQLKNNSGLKIVTDSSGRTSPYVFSPCCEFSPDIGNEKTYLPPLPPLEMPSFDFLKPINS